MINNDDIYFLGSKLHSEIVELYNISDLGVFPSKDEAFGLVFIECLASGTPVIGAKSGGPIDFINNKVGFLVEENDNNDILACEFSKIIIKAIKENWKL